MEEKEEVTRAERPRGESSRLRFSHVTADAPIRVRSTDSSSSPRRIMGGGNFLLQRMRGNDVENRKECPIVPLFSLSILSVLLASTLTLYILIMHVAVIIIIAVINFSDKIRM